MSQFVQIAVNTACSSAQTPSVRHIAMQCLSKEREPALTELIDALSRMFGRIGMHTVCRACHEGKLSRAAEQHGCCGSCMNLGHSACIVKPLGCARFMCDLTARLFPETLQFLNFIIGDVLYKAGVLAGGCYPYSVLYEDRRWKDGEFVPSVLGRGQKKLLRVLRYAVDAWEAE